MNKIFPQGDGNSSAAAGSEACPGAEAHCSPLCSSRRGACLAAFLLLLLAMLVALTALVAVLGLPSHTPGAQACVTPTNRTGFLCHDRRSCIPASAVCDGIRTCPHSEDEDEDLCRCMGGDLEFGNCGVARMIHLQMALRPPCPDVDFFLLICPSAGDVPRSLPSFLVAQCGDPASWIYSDQKCDGTNNCGDCSDELSPVTVCPPCGPGWWRCPSTFFQYCSCIPRTLCGDRVQHCSDWSDEYSCPGP